MQTCSLDIKSDTSVPIAVMWLKFPFCSSQIATVDKYQGQQNDYVLLSLVRTRAVGHIRDVRRLVVAMSRARLGMYVFGRRELFTNCYELRPTMVQLTERPAQFVLLPEERSGVSMAAAVVVSMLLL